MKRLFILLFLVFSLPFFTQAAEIKVNTDIDLSNTTIIENYYIAGGNLKLDAIFEKDLFIIGGNISVYGEVKGDVTIIGGEVNLANNVLGDLRVIGGTVNLSSTVNNDLVIVGGEVNLNEDAQIRGETLLLAAELNQNANLPIENTIVAGSVSISGEINGDTEITTQRITFQDGAKISGVLNYYAPTQAQEFGNVVKTGTISFNEINTIRETGIVKSAVINIMSFWLILKFITTLIVAFLLIQVFKYFTQKTINTAMNNPIKSFFSGLLAIIGIPFVAIILLISLIGIPVGFLLLLLYFVIVTITYSVAGIFTGTLVYNLFKEKNTQIDFQKATVGIILLTVLQFIGVLGELSIAIISIIAFGAIARSILGGVVYKR